MTKHKSTHIKEPVAQPGPVPTTKKPRLVCDRCGAEMHEQKCKIICPNCGSRFDCSDLNIYFD